MSNGIELSADNFSVQKFCQAVETICNCCGRCTSEKKDYKTYSRQVQESVDKRIARLMFKEGLNREDAVMQLMEGGE